MKRKLKVTINMDFENQFEDFLRKEGVEFKKIRYTKTMFRFKVVWPETKSTSILSSLPYVEKVEDYPIVVLD